MDTLCSPTLMRKVNHCIAIVGYGKTSDSSLPYWIGRNSWGNWGEGGYIRILRNAGNQICISSFALYPAL